MAEIQQAIDKANGKPYDFVYGEKPKSGAFKDVYFSPDRSYVIALFKKDVGNNDLRRLDKIVGEYREDIFKQEGGEFWKNLLCWPEAVVKYQGKIGVKVPVYSSHFFFEEGTHIYNADRSGKEKIGLWFASAKNFNGLSVNERGNLSGYLKVCLALSRATRRLHAAGLAHSDLSFKNCLVDPKGGRACIIDLDSLVVKGVFPAISAGTDGFQAPEVVSAGKLPSIETDRHALAVLNYYYLFHRHPLQGSKLHSPDDRIDKMMMMGEKALFIENPKDTSNRRNLDERDAKELPWANTSKIPYTIMGPYLKTLFDKAFIDGLHDPQKRPSAGMWEQAIINTIDLLLPCRNEKCPKRWFVYNNDNKFVCPYCGTKYNFRVPVLEFFSSRKGKDADYQSEKKSLVVYNTIRLHKWHIDKNIIPNEKLSNNDAVDIGAFAFHGGYWKFKNLEIEDLRYLRKGTTGAKRIAKGKHIILNDGDELIFSKEKKAVVRILNR